MHYMRASQLLALVEVLILSCFCMSQVCANDHGSPCHLPETVHAVACGDFFLWKLKQDPGSAFLPVTYCTASSGNSEQTKGSDAIATEGVDCQGHYTPCSAMCERGYEREWIVDTPSDGFGRSCLAPEMNPAEDCVVGDGQCGNTNPCDGGVLVDTSAGTGVLESMHPYPGRSNCDWIIKCGRWSTPRLTFRQFDTEQGHDWIEIYDGAADAAYGRQSSVGRSRSIDDRVADDGRQIARLSGQLQGADAYVPPISREMATIRLSTDGDTEGDGFTLAWTCS